MNNKQAAERIIKYDTELSVTINADTDIAVDSKVYASAALAPQISRAYLEALELLKRADTYATDTRKPRGTLFLDIEAFLAQQEKDSE